VTIADPASGRATGVVLADDSKRRRRDIVSPEGVALSVEIADNGERATALVLDLFIWLCATIVLCLTAWLTLGKLAPVMLQGSALAGIVLFVGFVIRNLYFIHFELAWQGATPGKRIIGLRVVDRAGGPLLPGAVIARNLTREIEAFMPIGILMSAQTQRWEMLSIGIWLMLFTLLPCFNRNHLRVGDLIAGTMVIAIPRRVLLGDLVETAARHSFTERQLGAYGAFELQVLEELLRRPENTESGRLRREVCERICRKIGWATPVAEADVALFLKDFYTAERAFLEREQLFGKPRADKNFRDRPGA
jgi:uncharacterized RDD family membrane protein YckC